MLTLESRSGFGHDTLEQLHRGRSPVERDISEYFGLDGRWPEAYQDMSRSGRLDERVSRYVK